MTNPTPPAASSVDRSLSDTSFIIYRSNVLKRYSVLIRALQAGEAVADTTSPSQLGPDYERFCREVLGTDPADPRYRIRRNLTAGGMGELYYVDERELRRQCAMKVILPELREHDLVVRNFVREARITAQLEHPNVIPVHDLGYHPEFGLYFTMKLIEGESLNDILHELETGNPDYAAKYDLWALLNIFRKVCDAVAFAHSRGILHRDIKPRNIMVGSYGEVYLLDWGLARALPGRGPDDLAEELAEAPEERSDGKYAVIKGSPGYMSPEQARGETRSLDQRSDVFLLGAALYNLITYYPPYIGERLEDVLALAQKGAYEPPENSCFNDMRMPTELYRIINRAMAAKPRDRYPTVEALCDDLDDLLHGKMKFQQRTFRKGQYLVREGDIGHESFIIESGEVEVVKRHGDKQLQLTVLGRGEIVGEMALITQQPRSASVRALTKTSVMVMTDERFTENLHKLPTWMEKAIVTLARRLYETDRKLTDVVSR